MKNMKKLIAMMLMVLSVFFFACDDDEVEPLSPEKAKTELNSMDEEMAADLEAMMNAEGMKAIQALNSMDDPFATAKSSLRTSVLPNIEEYLIPFIKTNKAKSAFEATEFDFDLHVGTYTYVHTPEPHWVIITGGDKIIVNFPSDSTDMGNNDATLTIYNYQEDVNYNPTIISAELEVDDVTIVEITLNASWTSESDPETLDISVYLKPFTFNGDLAITTTSAEVNFSILLNTTKIFSAGVDATFTDATQEVLKKVSGYVQYRDVKVSASVNVSNIMTILEQVENETSPYTTIEELVDAVNDEIDAKVTKDGALIAKIELDLVYNDDVPPVQELTVVLKFSDGTTEPAQPYFEGFISSIDEFFTYLDDYFEMK
ncbi:MAG: hypothetical protein A2041_08125 [Bacteroidetes bacterium GWA2_31_9b]|nr:MAG: hypothetical protein A2041_08125 [Bacteroidetes bacterium GWA2_31_9b]